MYKEQFGILTIEFTDGRIYSSIYKHNHEKISIYNYHNY